MAVFKAYQCRSCEQKFRFLHHPNSAPPPDLCLRCGSDQGVDEIFLPQAPAIRGVLAVAADQVYRSMEAASVARTEEMASIGGGSASDYAHTKITDLNDRQREGDISARMPPPGEVQRFMAANTTAQVGSQHAAIAQQYASQVSQGYMPNAGDRTRQVLTGGVHNQMRARMQALGEMNKA